MLNLSADVIINECAEGFIFLKIKIQKCVVVNNIDVGDIQLGNAGQYTAWNFLMKFHSALPRGLSDQPLNLFEGFYRTHIYDGCQRMILVGTLIRKM